MNRGNCLCLLTNFLFWRLFKIIVDFLVKNKYILHLLSVIEKLPVEKNLAKPANMLAHTPKNAPAIYESFSDEQIDFTYISYTLYIVYEQAKLVRKSIRLAIVY